MASNEELRGGFLGYQTSLGSSSAVATGCNASLSLKEKGSNDRARQYLNSHDRHYSHRKGGSDWFHGQFFHEKHGVGSSHALSRLRRVAGAPKKHCIMTNQKKTLPSLSSTPTPGLIFSGFCCKGHEITLCYDPNKIGFLTVANQFKLSIYPFEMIMFY